MTALTSAVTRRELDSAIDRAAVLHARLPDADKVGGGPLPWLAGIPPLLAGHPRWGPYVTGRARLVTELAEQVRTDAAARLPGWAADIDRPLPEILIGDIEVWRAASQVEPADRRPTGSAQLERVARNWQMRLDESLATGAPQHRRLDPNNHSAHSHRRNRPLLR